MRRERSRALSLGHSSSSRPLLWSGSSSSSFDNQRKPFGQEPGFGRDAGKSPWFLEEQTPLSEEAKRQAAAFEAMRAAERQQNRFLLYVLGVVGTGVLLWTGYRSLPWLRTYVWHPATRKARKGWTRFSTWWLAE